MSKLLSENQFLKLSDFDLENLYKSLCLQLESVCFSKLSPARKTESRGLLSGLSNLNGVFNQQSAKYNSDEYIENILNSTIDAYKRTGFKPSISGNILRRTLSYKRLQEINFVIENYKAIMNREKVKNLEGEQEIGLKKEHWDNMEDLENLDFDDNIKAQTIIVDDAKVLAILESTAWADLAIIKDKYTIRLGDGKYWVASDEIKIVMRDPSERPSWGIWFMSAVPLEKIPNQAAMMFMDEKEWGKYEPPSLGENFIVCHASLWQNKKKSLVLLHCSWNHLSSTYKWVIDKPIDVASVLFKAVSHPAHLARNFGYSPNLAIPGSEW